MINDKQCTPEDFIENISFRNWVYKRESVQNVFWDQFVAEHPQHIEAICQAKEILLAIMEESDIISEAAIDQKADRIVSMVNAANKSKPVHIFKKTNTIWQWGAGVAAVLLLGIIYLFPVNPSPPQPALVYEKQIENVEKKLIEVINTSATAEIFTLPDGSRITLRRNSRFSYPPGFEDDKREVYLSGEAFFEVAKNPVKPFLVHSNELVTKVLGTSFNIKAYASDTTVEVAVETGKVSVFTQENFNEMPRQSNSKSQKGVLLQPNQQAVYSRKKAILNKELVEKPEALVAVTEKTAFIYDDVQVSTVLVSLEKVYGIKIIFDEQIMGNCKIRADLSEEDLFEKLNIITKVTNGTYQVIDGQIVISAKGC